MQHSYCTDISWSSAQPGDLVFYPDNSHVGIVGGRDENGNLLVIHCASGYNNAVMLQMRRRATSMNKTELIAAMSEVSGLTKKDAEAALNACTAVVTDALKAGDSVQLIGFGTFEVRERAARQGRNPHTGETIEIAAAKAPAFKPGKALKDAIQ